MPKVSVIIPVYNVEKYICQCLNSCINQTLKDIEIICIDDKSTDNSLEILKEYAAKDERIQVYTHDINIGQGIARNLGIEKAKGEYIMFLDSDDWYENDACEKAYNQAKNNNNDICLFGYSNFYNTSEEKKSAFYMLKPYEKSIDETSINLKDIDENFIISMYAPMYIYKKDYLDKHEIKFSEDRLGEDVIFMTKVFLNEPSVSVLSEALYIYRQIPKSEKNKGSSLDDNKYELLFEVRNKAMNIIIKSQKDFLIKAFLIYYIRSIIYWYKVFCKTAKPDIKRNFYNKMREKFIFFNELYDIYSINHYIDYKFFRKIIGRNYFCYSIINLAKNIFSIANEHSVIGKHKVLRVLGIKLSIKV